MCSSCRALPPLQRVTRRWTLHSSQGRTIRAIQCHSPLLLGIVTRPRSTCTMVFLTLTSSRLLGLLQCHSLRSIMASLLLPPAAAPTATWYVYEFLLNFTPFVFFFFPFSFPMDHQTAPCCCVAPPTSNNQKTAGSDTQPMGAGHFQLLLVISYHIAITCLIARIFSARPHRASAIHAGAQLSRSYRAAGAKVFFFLLRHPYR